MIIGPPPVGRWNYLTIAARPFDPPPTTVVPAKDSFSQLALLPAIRTRGGVAVAVAERTRANVFDFGFTRGRVRVTREFGHSMSRVVNVRFANIRPELALLDYNLRPVVFAPGESTVTTTEPHNFRYVMVFGRGMGAEVVQ